MEQMVDLKDLSHSLIGMRHNRSPGVLVKQRMPEKIRSNNRRAAQLTRFKQHHVVVITNRIDDFNLRWIWNQRF